MRRQGDLAVIGQSVASLDRSRLEEQLRRVDGPVAAGDQQPTLVKEPCEVRLLEPAECGLLILPAPLRLLPTRQT